MHSFRHGTRTELEFRDGRWDEELAAGIDAEIHFVSNGGTMRQAVLALMRIFGAGEFRIQNPEFRLSDFRTFGLSDFRTFQRMRARSEFAGDGIPDHGRRSRRPAGVDMLERWSAGSDGFGCGRST